MAKFLHISCFCILLIGLQASAQRLNPTGENLDSLQKLKARDTLFLNTPVTPSTIIYSREELKQNLTGGHTPDTSLSGIHRINPIMQNDFAAISLGNIGLAEKKLYLWNPYPESFRFRLDPYHVYFFDPRNVRFYDTKTPYTDLYFTQTGKKEQVIRVSHSRSFKKVFNAGIDFQKLKSEGIYRRQEIDYGSAQLFARYRLPSGRYQAAAAVIRNKGVVQENGGLAYDTVPLFFTGDKAFLPVNMTNASNTTKTKNFFLDHTVFLGPKSVGDSLAPSVVEPLLALTHSVAYDVKDEIYHDQSPDQLNYINIVPPTGRIYDSLRVKDLSNTVSLQSVGSRFRKLADFEIYGKTEKITVGQAYTDTSFSNVHAGIKLQRDFFGLLRSSINSRYTLSGYNANDRFVIAGVETLKDSFSFYAGVWLNSSLYEPDYFYKVSRSPVYKWRIDTLQKISIQEATGVIGFFNNKLSLRGTYSIIDNYTYLDEFEFPAQHRKTLQYVSATLHGHLTIARKWHFVHDILFQQASDTSVIHLPMYAARLTYYYNNRIFKKKLEVEGGFEVNYAEKFFADAYAPGIRSFYLQSGIQGAGYPYVDIFFKFKVRNRARIFFKYEHVNSGLVFLPYFTVPVYAQADRKLKLGVSWKFFD